MERLTLHKLTSAYDYAKSNLSQEEAAKIYDRLSELEDQLEDGTLIKGKGPRALIDRLAIENENLIMQNKNLQAYIDDLRAMVFKEILQDVLSFLRGWNNGLLDRVIDAFKEKYGVEVE